MDKKYLIVHGSMHCNTCIVNKKVFSKKDFSNFPETLMQVCVSVLQREVGSV